MAGGNGWSGKGRRLEYQRGTNHRANGTWLTGSHVSQYGRTPLHWAALHGHAAVVVAFLAEGADKDAKDQVMGGGGVQGESGAGRCGMGSRPTCGPGVCV